MLHRISPSLRAGWRASVGLLLCALLAPGPVQAEDDFQSKIDAAIRSGCAWLEVNGNNPGAGLGNTTELVALALIHGGADRNQEPLKGAIRHMRTAPLSSTYNVALTAIALCNLDRARYQKRIQECAQWLVDSQCANGQWSYGDFRGQALPGTTPTESDGLDAASGPLSDVALQRQRPATTQQGDNSNTQFAVMGLWAAHLARIQSPAATWKRIRDFFIRCQGSEGGWSYSEEMRAAPYFNMTCAGTAVLEICRRVTKPDNRLDSAINLGRYWIGRSWGLGALATDEKRGGWVNFRDYYGYYSLERVGVLLNQERFGEHKWYTEGARSLLKAQAENGGWDENAINTAFAVLFLKRATQSLSGGHGTGARGTVSTPDDELGEE